MHGTSQARRGQGFPGAGYDRAFKPFANVFVGLPFRIVIQKCDNFPHILQRRRIVFQVGLRIGLEDARVTADRDHLFDLQSGRPTDGGSEDEPAARGITNEKCLTDTQSFEKSLQMFNSQARGIGKAIELVRQSPAEQVGSDDVKSLRQTFDVCAPGDLGGSAILTAVEQYEIRSAAGLHKVGFDVASDDVSMVIRSHVRKIQFG